jgi:ABC-type transport system involved in multi-copper enzyme maturation permease subunit
MLAIALNTYRENVRARLLHGLFALALATAGYSLVVGAYAFRDTVRVVSDVGGASVSLYGIVVALVLGATALHRELELKTAFPILARPIARWEYLVGKFAGVWLTLLAFVAVDTGALLLSVALIGGGSIAHVLGLGLGILAVTVLVGWRWPRWRVYLPLVLALGWMVCGWWLAAVAPDERRVLLFGMLLALGEIGIVIAVANVFSAFSSPFLSAMLTLGIVVVGRSADTLARLPARVFGEEVASTARWVAKVVPNLMVYVPPRALMTGETPGTSIGVYLVLAMTMSVGWVVFLLVVSALVFRRRDFT